MDAEAGLFLADEPMGPGDRVLAGLSVAFDASCEEMWLAWRSGACLVPAPRSLVRTGVDLGPWLVEQEITVVSTVPTLAALWPVEALDDVRLLIFGGEACPPELAERMAVEDREVWNTYGPTEATVVACAAQLTGEGPVRIGLPLDGWELAVVDARGEVVPMGEVGELVIGGVGLARYLDPAKDAEKYAPLPPWAGRGRTAAVTWCAPRRRGCCSSAGPTNRSSWAAAGSSWARSTPRCRRCRAWRAPRPRCARRRRATSCWWAMSSRKNGAASRGGRAGPAARGAARRAGAAARGGRHAADPYLRQGGPGRAALAAAGRRRGRDHGRADRDRELAGRAVGRGAGHPRERAGRRLLKRKADPQSERTPNTPSVLHKTLNLNGIEIFYREAGPLGAPVVLLPHGYPCSSFQYRALMPMLADRWHLVAPDFPGFGYSGTPTENAFDYDFDGYADFLDRFAAARGLKRYALYLHDYGSQIGLRHAIARPERITALIIQNGDIYEDALGPKYETIKRYWSNPSDANRKKLEDAVNEEGLRAEFVGEVSDTVAERMSPDLWKLHWPLMNTPCAVRSRSG